MNKIDASISVVVPVYNSSNTLERLAERLVNVLERFNAYEIILVDDASYDQSFEKIRKIAKVNPSITGLALSENSGQQCAILCGMRYAKYDYTVIIDDDLEHNPEDILKLYREIEKGYDAVYAISAKKNIRGIGSVMRDILFKLLTDIPKGIKVSSYRILNRQTRQSVIIADTTFVYISMERLKYTNNIANIKAESGPKAATNYSFIKLAKLYWNILKTYSKNSFFKQAKIKGACYKTREIVGGGTQ